MIYLKTACIDVFVDEPHSPTATTVAKATRKFTTRGRFLILGHVPERLSSLKQIHS